MYRRHSTAPLINDLSPPKGTGLGSLIADPSASLICKADKTGMDVKYGNTLSYKNFAPNLGFGSMADLKTKSQKAVLSIRAFGIFVRLNATFLRIVTSVGSTDAAW